MLTFIRCVRKRDNIICMCRKENSSKENLQPHDKLRLFYLADILLPADRVNYARRDAIFSTIKRKQTFRIDNESCQARNRPIRIGSSAIAEPPPYIISQSRVIKIDIKYVTRDRSLPINRMMHFNSNQKERK